MSEQDATPDLEMQKRCLREWATVNDPPCHPSDPGWNGCPDCRNPTPEVQPVNSPVSEYTNEATIARLIEAVEYALGPTATIYEAHQRLRNALSDYLRCSRQAKSPGDSYRRMFHAAVISLAEISRALYIPEDVAACADGNKEILASIAELQAAASDISAVPAPVAWLHEVTADDGDPVDKALSFTPDTFPFEGVAGFRSVSVRPLVYGGEVEALNAWPPEAVDLQPDTVAVCADLERELGSAWAKCAELQSRWDREVEGLNNEGDPIGGDPPIGLRQRVERAERDTKLLGELLAIIHRDGGHYQSKHGTEQAVKDALKKVSSLRLEASEAFEDFCLHGIANSPAPISDMGAYLARVLDEDEWPNAEKLLLQLATHYPQECERDVDARRYRLWRDLSTGKLEDDGTFGAGWKSLPDADDFDIAVDALALRVTPTKEAR